MNSLVEDHEDCTDGSGICSNVAQSRLQYARWNLPTQLLGLIGWIILVVKHDSHLMLHKFGGSRPFLEDSLLVANIAVSSSWSTPPDLSIIIESRVGLVEEDAPKEIEVTGWTKQYKTTKHFTTITRHSARRRLPPPLPLPLDPICVSLMSCAGSLSHVALKIEGQTIPNFDPLATSTPMVVLSMDGMKSSFKGLWTLWPMMETGEDHVLESKATRPNSMCSNRYHCQWQLSHHRVEQWIWHSRQAHPTLPNIHNDW